MLTKIACAACTTAVLVVAGPLFHMRSVQVAGDSWAVTQAEVTAALAESGKMTTLAIDLDAFEEAIERRPQVRKAVAQRSSNHKVVLHIEARIPLARTPAGALLDVHGDLYYGVAASKLAIYDGPPAKAAQFADVYAHLRVAEARAGFDVNQVSWHKDGWRVLLDKGWMLNLGTAELDSRIMRFAKAYAQLDARFGTLAKLEFDLRYMRGMAIAGLPAEIEEIEQTEKTDEMENT